MMRNEKKFTFVNVYIPDSAYDKKKNMVAKTQKLSNLSHQITRWKA